MHDLRERVQGRAAVRVHHALRPPGRAARVVDADRVVLALEPILGLTVAGGFEERLVVAAGPADEHALDRGVLDEVAQRLVDDEDARAGVLEDVGDLVGHEPRVDRDEHGAGAWHAEVRLEQLVDVRREERDPVAARDPALLERDGEPPHPLAHFRPGEAALAVDDGGPAGEDECGPLEECERRQPRVRDVVDHAGLEHELGTGGGMVTPMKQRDVGPLSRGS